MNERQRIDVWLFRTRLVRTRADAARLIDGRDIRLSRPRYSKVVDKQSQRVAAGDVLTITDYRSLKHIEVISLPSRRGSAATAKACYRQLEWDAHCPEAE